MLLRFKLKQQQVYEIARMKAMHPNAGINILHICSINKIRNKFTLQP